MFGFFKSKIKEKIQNTKFIDTDDVVRQWDAIGSIIVNCKRKDVKYVDELLNMCYAKYQKTLLDYYQQMSEICVTSRSDGRRLYECYDMIQKYNQEYENLVKDLSTYECDEVMVNFKISAHHIRVMGDNLQRESDACKIIYEIAKTHYNPEVRNITKQMDELKEQQSITQKKLKTEYMNNKMYQPKGKELLTTSDYELRNDMEISAMQYAFRHSETGAIMDKISELGKQRRKLMEEV